jgi:hypothetical protein
MSSIDPLDNRFLGLEIAREIFGFEEMKLDWMTASKFSLDLIGDIDRS